MNTLKVLYATRARLLNSRIEYRYTNWTQCTCGHIYAAATGRKARKQHHVHTAKSGVYADVIVAVARALGWDGYWRGLHPDDTEAGNAAEFVSDCAAGGRAAAVAIIDRAIATIEKQEREARDAVLAQAKAIVDAAAERVMV